MGFVGVRFFFSVCLFRVEILVQLFVSRAVRFALLIVLFSSACCRFPNLSLSPVLCVSPAFHRLCCALLMSYSYVCEELGRGWIAEGEMERRKKGGVSVDQWTGKTNVVLFACMAKHRDFFWLFKAETFASSVDLHRNWICSSVFVHTESRSFGPTHHSKHHVPSVCLF